MENFPGSQTQRIYKVVFLVCFVFFYLSYDRLIKPVEVTT